MSHSEYESLVTTLSDIGRHWLGKLFQVFRATSSGDASTRVQFPPPSRLHSSGSCENIISYHIISYQIKITSHFPYYQGSFRVTFSSDALTRIQLLLLSIFRSNEKLEWILHQIQYLSNFGI